MSIPINVLNPTEHPHTQLTVEETADPDRPAKIILDNGQSYGYVSMTIEEIDSLAGALFMIKQCHDYDLHDHELPF